LLIVEVGDNLGGRPPTVITLNRISVINWIAFRVTAHIGVDGRYVKKKVHTLCDLQRLMPGAASRV